MSYKVIVRFTDLQDDNHRYLAGDTYPREGLTPSKERIAELASTENKRGIVLIEEVVEEATAEAPIEAETAEETKEPVNEQKPKRQRKKVDAE